VNAKIPENLVAQLLHKLSAGEILECMADGPPAVLATVGTAKDQTRIAFFAVGPSADFEPLLDAIDALRRKWSATKTEVTDATPASEPK